MLFDLDNPLQREQFLARASRLAKAGGVAELAAKRPRSLRQNSYLHVAIAYWAAQEGFSLAEAKQVFKQVCAHVFARRIAIPAVGDVLTFRSTSDLSAEELSSCIDRWRDWVAQNYGWHIPSPDDHRLVQQMEVEVSRNQKLL